MKQILTDSSIHTAPAGKEALPSRRPPRIGIWGHYAGNNQGDELLVATVLANIRARIPDAEIVGYCLNPVDTRQRHGIPAFPIYRFAEGNGRPARFWTPAVQAETSPAAGPSHRVKVFIKRRRWLLLPLQIARGTCRFLLHALRKIWNALTFPVKEIPFLRRCYRALCGTDLLIVAGSGPLYDGWSGPWVHPYALFMWSRLARLTGTRFVCLSTGAGPLSSRLGRFFVRHAMRKTSYRSYRDPSSAGLIASLGVEGEHPVMPDMGFGLDVGRYVGPWDPPGAVKGRTIVGLSMMAHCDPRYIPRNDPPRYDAFIRKIAELTAHLLRSDYAVMVVSSDIAADPRSFADVREILRRDHGLGEDPRLVEPRIEGLSELASAFSACDYVIAARYHCIVLPCLLGKPVLALAYNRKQIDLMELMGQQAYCLDIDRFEVGELVERFERMQRDRDAICGQLRERVERCRRRLAEQYDRVLGPLAAAHSFQDPTPETNKDGWSSAMREEVGRWKA